MKPIAPRYARPFVKRQKNDAADAEAIVMAARQPEMRFVAPRRLSISPALRCSEVQDLLAQIAEKTARIAERTTKLKTLAAQSDRARRLQTMPGVDPLKAVAVEAFGPDMAEFKTGRDFAA